eukprot:TRINITY_DN63084_c0_g1_i1.p3 TRINITY_DN63084_c0_g1~~TRINITY_DN63084_c0_g1_i1.p3  ORF type:complete len:130 (+),score=19.07 TRINITY_DN63084_c0_g1_i1:87-476(+)
MSDSIEEQLMPHNAAPTGWRLIIYVATALVRMPPVQAFLLWGVAQCVVKTFGSNWPDWVCIWTPLLVAVVSWVGLTRLSKYRATRAASGLVGQAAPDFTIELMDRTTTTLRTLLASKGLPTVLDFYQNS